MDRHYEPLREVLDKLLQEQRELVANTDKLAAAVAANQTAVADNTTAIQAAIETITSDADQAAVDAATTAVETNTQQIEANTQSLKNAVNPPVAPVVTAISPTSGPAAGATTVTITGKDLTGTTAVAFGTVEATNVVVVSDTEVTADSPTGTEGTTVDVTVTTPLGTSPTGVTFGYTA